MLGAHEAELLYHLPRLGMWPTGRRGLYRPDHRRAVAPQALDCSTVATPGARTTDELAVYATAVRVHVVDDPE